MSFKPQQNASGQQKETELRDLILPSDGGKKFKLELKTKQLLTPSYDPLQFSLQKKQVPTNDNSLARNCITKKYKFLLGEMNEKNLEQKGEEQKEELEKKIVECGIEKGKSFDEFFEVDVKSLNSESQESKFQKKHIVDYHLGNQHVKLLYLKNLYFLLLKIYFGVEIEETDLSLNDFEMCILKEFIKRKNKRNKKNKIFFDLLKDTDFANKGDLKELLIRFNEIESSKRSEENIKFVYKLTVKRLKLNLKDSRRYENSNENLELAFYKHYFQELADLWGLSLQIFYDPLSVSGQHKKFNNDYVCRIFSSSKFKKDFSVYLMEDFSLDYISGIPNKILKILSRFDSLYREREEKGVKEVEKYFRKNKQCKLPWTEKEIQKAIDDFNTTTNRL